MDRLALHSPSMCRWPQYLKPSASREVPVLVSAVDYCIDHVLARIRAWHMTMSPGPSYGSLYWLGVMGTLRIRSLVVVSEELL